MVKTLHFFLTELSENSFFRNEKINLLIQEQKLLNVARLRILFSHMSPSKLMETLERLGFEKTPVGGGASTQMFVHPKRVNYSACIADHGNGWIGLEIPKRELKTSVDSLTALLAEDYTALRPKVIENPTGGKLIEFRKRETAP
ncbi:MAG: hypothetical protein V1835_07430 [Candidatus Micrarchaeota archaeon]